MNLRTSVELIYLLLAVLFVFAAGYNLRNVSSSPSVGRWLTLAIVCVVIVAVLRFF